MVYYSPPYETLQSPFQEIEQIYSDWSHFTTSWIILGDFNARIGNEIDSDYSGFNPAVFSLRNSMDNEINKKGKLLLNWVKKSDLFILNGRMKGDYPGRYTFISAAGTSVIDYIICTESVIDQCAELRVLDDDLSDHFPVTLSIKTNVLTYKNELSKEILTQTKKHKYNTNKFEAEIGYRTALIHEVKPDQIYSILINIYNEYIIEQSPQSIQQSLKMKNKFKQKWFDLRCYRAKKLKEYYLTLFRKIRSKERLTDYISAKRTYNNLIKAKKRNYYNNLNRRLYQIKTIISFFGQ
ncbi:uncharacterized protein [Centruroides vittatus]|uniref:uncharacterized protein n=1 Tax=Centruroides vittatus TaxID=120091 RepID=UPI00351036A6